MSEIFTIEEVRKYNGKNGSPVWIIIKNSVYDVTPYLGEHPGGEELIIEYAGKDATKAFNEAGHSSDADKMLKKFKIGQLAIREEGSVTKAPAYAEETEKTQREKRKRVKFFFCM